MKSSREKTSRRHRDAPFLLFVMRGRDTVSVYGKALAWR